MLRSAETNPITYFGMKTVRGTAATAQEEYDQLVNPSQFVKVSVCVVVDVLE